jgi:hypothetical protein
MATLKYSNTGMVLWTRIYKGPSVFSFHDDGRAVAVDRIGNVIVTGRSYDAGNSDNADFATVAYSNESTPLWTQRYNGPANGDDTPWNRKSLGLGPDGSVYVTGASDQDPSTEQQYQFAVVRYGEPVNIPPTVSISSPPSGSSFVSPANVAITANASDSDGSIDRVDFYSGDVLLGSTAAEPFEITWNNVPAGTYSIGAIATDNVGETATSAVVNISVTEALPPTAPFGLSATAISHSRITLSWTDNSGDELGFKIERSTKSKPFKQIAITGPNATTYADKGLSAGQKYTYRVRAYSSSGDSRYSNTANAKTKGKRVFSWF